MTSTRTRGDGTVAADQQSGDDRPPGRRAPADLPTPDFARVFDEAPAPFLLLTPDLVIVHANRARLEATATTLEDTVGRHLFDVFPLNPDDPGADGVRNVADTLALTRDTRRPVTMPIQKYDIPLPDGTWVERFWSPRNVPILDDDGRVVLLLHRSDDITDYVRDRDEARQEAARGQHRVERVEADLFARTRELERLNAELRESSRRERRTADSLAGLAATVSALAAAETTSDLLERVFHHSWSALQAEVVAVALAGPGGLRVTERRDGRPVSAALDPASPLPMAVAATTGEAVLVEDAGAGDAPPAPAPGTGSWAALPLRAGGRLLGSWTLGWRGPRAFEDHDVRVLEAHAAQCAQAVDRVTRLEAERRRARETRTLAETLQRSMLTEPPAPDHLRIAVRYRPAAREAQVGGDWYDAFLSPDGATTLVVGDVTGHDRVAASVMGQLRNVLRGVVHALDAPPARALSALDRALRDLGMSTLVTALLARVEQSAADAGTGTRTLRWSSAGHLPPLLLAADGTARLLERAPELLLGVDPGVRRTDTTTPLHPGDTVVLYTDGLVERRDADLDDGLARLVEAGRALSGATVEELCDGLLTRLAPEYADDVALLALHACPQQPRTG
ncbi:SpoIIE family protein phosphatase [Geodermatophilus sp. DSM 44513]|uniref:SpoIIE family protein phosphatase n=1 Tax=Geodermatophilus sp. DSM 44513 TaxID=1528104 RepID=UPI001AA16198|nr:SpoIIE family protein phosphatase [Geodermatophilus sp. DSM 44513]WNV74483.1 SpoIIE family protein phosphatase [Geodermatophilus sp. DSM 44513]